MQAELIKKRQIEFFQKSRAGCAFAAFAAKQPEYYGWFQRVIEAQKEPIDDVLSESKQDSAVKMVSLIFPSVRSLTELRELTGEMQSCQDVVLEQDQVFEEARCLGFRLKVGDALSWMSGFGKFDFLPKTRQAPYTEVTVRVKSRPDYEWVLKEHPADTIHVADLDMKGLAEDRLKRLWDVSFNQTRQVLGHEPDLRSAAKTTFSIPL